MSLPLWIMCISLTHTFLAFSLGAPVVVLLPKLLLEKLQKFYSQLKMSQGDVVSFIHEAVVCVDLLRPEPPATTTPNSRRHKFITAGFNEIYSPAAVKNNAVRGFTTELLNISHEVLALLVAHKLQECLPTFTRALKFGPFVPGNTLPPHIDLAQSSEQFAVCNVSNTKYTLEIQPAKGLKNLKTYHIEVLPFSCYILRGVNRFLCTHAQVKPIVLEPREIMIFGYLDYNTIPKDDDIYFFDQYKLTQTDQ
jgi:hypothetical protein